MPPSRPPFLGETELPWSSQASFPRLQLFRGRAEEGGRPDPASSWPPPAPRRKEREGLPGRASVSDDSLAEFSRGSLASEALCKWKLEAMSWEAWGARKPSGSLSKFIPPLKESIARRRLSRRPPPRQEPQQRRRGGGARGRERATTSSSSAEIAARAGRSAELFHPLGCGLGSAGERTQAAPCPVLPCRPLSAELRVAPLVAPERGPPQPRRVARGGELGARAKRVTWPRPSVRKWQRSSSPPHRPGGLPARRARLSRALSARWGRPHSPRPGRPSPRKLLGWLAAWLQAPAPAPSPAGAARPPRWLCCPPRSARFALKNADCGKVAGRPGEALSQSGGAPLPTTACLPSSQRGSSRSTQSRGPAGADITGTGRCASPDEALGTLRPGRGALIPRKHSYSGPILQPPALDTPPPVTCCTA